LIENASCEKAPRSRFAAQSSAGHRRAWRRRWGSENERRQTFGRGPERASTADDNLDHIPVISAHFVIAGHSASEDAREHAYDWQSILFAKNSCEEW